MSSFYGTSSMLNLLFIFLFENFSKTKKISNTIYLMENQPWEKPF